MDIYHFRHFFSGPTSSRSSTWTFQLWSGPTLWPRRFSRTRYWEFPKTSWFWSLLQVFCSDILDAITKDFFARKQHTPDETMHVEDIQVLEAEIKTKAPCPVLSLRWSRPNSNSQASLSADRPGYERTSSSLWKQREEYCAALLQRAWIEYQVKILKDNL